MFNTSPGVPSIDPIAMTLVSWRPSLIRIVMTSTSPVTSAGMLGRSEEEGKDRVGRVACGTASGKRSGDYKVSIGLRRTRSLMGKSPICSATECYEIGCRTTDLTVHTSIRVDIQPDCNEIKCISKLINSKPHYLRYRSYLRCPTPHLNHRFLPLDPRPTSPSSLH